MGLAAADRIRRAGGGTCPGGGECRRSVAQIMKANALQPCALQDRQEILVQHICVRRRRIPCARHSMLGSRQHDSPCGFRYPRLRLSARVRYERRTPSCIAGPWWVCPWPLAVTCWTNASSARDGDWLLEREGVCAIVHPLDGDLWVVVRQLLTARPPHGIVPCGALPLFSGGHRRNHQVDQAVELIVGGGQLLTARVHVNDHHGELLKREAISSANQIHEAWPEAHRRRVEAAPRRQ